MAGGEVGLGLRRGTLGAHSVAHALVRALRLLPALLIAALVGAVACAAGTLAGTDGGARQQPCEMDPLVQGTPSNISEDIYFLWILF